MCSEFDIDWPRNRGRLTLSAVFVTVPRTSYSLRYPMPQPLPRCRVVPLSGHQTAVEIDGGERLRWHFGDDYPRPHFFPLIGPAGVPLTRMGHPGAPNHDHHQSVWFAHHQVLGVSFWSNNSPAVIRQQHWLAYQDSDEEALMAMELRWYDGHDPKELLQQEMVAVVRPGPRGETFLELQSTFRPTAQSLEFRKTNFGFLAVRVAKSIAAYFGGGKLTDSEGRINEPAIFGKKAKWMDYSGPVKVGENGESIWNGITFIDHPENPGHPTHWHVREDGWMGASACLAGPLVTTREAPLRLRYLLHLHDGPVKPALANRLLDDFSSLAPWAVSKSKKKHTHAEVAREKSPR